MIDKFEIDSPPPTKGNNIRYMVRPDKQGVILQIHVNGENERVSYNKKELKAFISLLKSMYNMLEP